MNTLNIAYRMLGLLLQLRYSLVQGSAHDSCELCGPHLAQMNKIIAGLEVVLPCQEHKRRPDDQYSENSPCYISYRDGMGLWKCDDCGRWVCLGYGAADDHPGLCDGCWAVKTRTSICEAHPDGCQGYVNHAKGEGPLMYHEERGR